MGLDRFARGIRWIAWPTGPNRAPVFRGIKFCAESCGLPQSCPCAPAFPPSSSACCLRHAPRKTSPRPAFPKHAPSPSRLRACKDYPDRFPVIDRAQWISSGRYWVIDLTDPNRERGKFYMIDRHGQIIGTGRIPQDSTLPQARSYSGRHDYYDSGYNDRRYYDDEPVYRGRAYY